MTIEEFNEHISSLLKGGEVADLTNNATSLQDDYATMLAEKEESSKEIERLKKENQSLKDTNYDLLLKRGIETKENRNNEQTKTETRENHMSVADYVALETKKVR